MKHVFFFITFFVQLATGFPLAPLFLFWQILYAEFTEILFWSLLVSLSLAAADGAAIGWLGGIAGISIAGFFARKYLFSRFSPSIITGLLFFYTIALWSLYNGGRISMYGGDIVKTAFIYFFLFFIAYAVVFQKKMRYQRKLF